MKLNDKVAIVTGGLSGLGRGTVDMLVSRGNKVGVLDVGGPAASERTKAVEGPDVAVFPTDVRNAEDVAAAVDGVAERFGRVDLLVNCAGVADAARVLDKKGTMFPLDTYKKVVDINLVGLFDVVRNAVRHMANNDPIEGERGVIVNVASIAGYEGQAGQAAYAASKGGVIAMTLPLARDLGSLGIRVLTVCPGIFDTSMLASASDQLRERLVDIHVFPKRLGRPEDFAHLVASIAENPMLNGEVIRLDAATRLAHG